jgi:hypothetical protein
MSRRIIGMLAVGLGLLAAGCADQATLGPSAATDGQPSLSRTAPDTTISTSPQGKKGGGPGGSAGGLK